MPRSLEEIAAQIDAQQAFADDLTEQTEAGEGFSRTFVYEGELFDDDLLVLGMRQGGGGHVDPEVTFPLSDAYIWGQALIENHYSTGPGTKLLEGTFLLTVRFIPKVEEG